MAQIQHLYRAIRKYGAESFVLDVLAEAENVDQALNLERVWIVALDACRVGYNSTFGGDGMSHPTQETLQKLIVAGRRHTHHTPEAKAKISAAGLGRRMSEEAKQKLRMVRGERKRRAWPQESRDKLSATLRHVWAKRKVKPMSEKDSLVPMTPEMKDPYRAKASEFKAPKGGKYGDTPGEKDQLCSGVDSPRHCEDSGAGESGAGTPTDWTSGGRAGHVSGAFPVGQAQGGEAGSGGASTPCSVDLQSGQTEVAGYKQTVAKETPKAYASVPSR